ncbi:hypothetical protein Gasu2_28330 [Galdieria sulphuraria]|nr:hypothetical protein Gasu2_28330 [Galdieria sulphuraria]
MRIGRRIIYFFGCLFYLTITLSSIGVATQTLRGGCCVTLKKQLLLYYIYILSIIVKVCQRKLVLYVTAVMASFSVLYCLAKTEYFNARHGNPKTVQFFQSENGQFILFGLVCYLVLSGKISWIFDSFLIFFSVISIIPIIGLLVFRWWVTQNVVQVFCPNCSSPVVGIKVIIAKDSSNRKDGNKKKQSTISVIDVDAREFSQLKLFHSLWRTSFC